MHYSKGMAEPEGVEVSKAMRRAYFAGTLFLVLLGMGFVFFRSNARPGTDSIAEQANWLSDEKSAIRLAKERNTFLVIDFYADWCVPCHELDRYVLQDPRVAKALSEAVLLRFDVTQNNEKTGNLMDRFRVDGLPTVLFMTPSGQILHELTLTGVVSPEEFLEALDEARGSL